MKQAYLFRAAVVATMFWTIGLGSRVQAAKVDYNRDIRPILSNNCYACHGPDAQERQAGLRLDMRESATAKLDSGATAIVAGQSAASELVKRITTADANLQMPPPESGMKLTPEQIALVKQWIAEGAEFRGHWAFIAPVRPTPAAVKDEASIANPIDRFVLSRLEAEGLTFSPLADKVTLIRRATLDLTGLPPTMDEVDAFLSDNSPQAYEKAVNRLVESPRYGEHMARYWLDLARYGDTHGLHFDNERALWPYRDWVIRAYNSNKPFDQFTIEQLAGDLLPNSTLDQKVATGFNRCNVTTNEGGSINDEVLVRYAVDRTETMSTVFLGLTAGCAVCHDHKFDPLSQKEFYSLYAFFNASADSAMDGNKLAPPPIVKLESAEVIKQREAFDARLAAVRKRVSDALAKVNYQDPGAATPRAPDEFKEVVWIEDDVPAGGQAQGNTPWSWVEAPRPVHSGKRASHRAGEGITQHFFTGASAPLVLGEGDKLFAYVYVDPQNPPKTVMLQFNDGSWEHRAFWGDDAVTFGAPGTKGHVHMGELPKAGEWVRLECTAEQVGLPAGSKINGWAFTQFSGSVYWDKAGIVTKINQGPKSFESLAAWEESVRQDKKPSHPKEVVDAIKVEAEKRNDAQKKQIRDYFLTRIHPKIKAPFQPLLAEEATIEKERSEFDKNIPVSMVMQDLPKPRDTFILIRGAYNKKGEKVEANVPAAFPPLPQDAPRNRLGLAQWLVSDEHPLTARVAVNRYWQQLFGRGLVKTSEDFGAQGEWPSHPELLDWLAVDFRESGWDVKRLMKQMVMSRTYRQSSRVTPALLARDPENALLSRGPRFRMDAEMVRDSALATSGLLVEQVGGKSVRPYQPSGLWQAVSFRSSNTGSYQADKGEGLYRRSLYTFWKRTSPPPSMSTLDAPSRETCVSRRARTNTPLQALLLMNDEQYVEASRNLAGRMLRDGGTAPSERLSYGFRLVTARRPNDAELAVLAKVLSQHEAKYQADPESAKKLLAIGESKRDEKLDPVEHATWTMVANLLLNLDETITKE